MLDFDYIFLDLDNTIFDQADYDRGAYTDIAKAALPNAKAGDVAAFAARLLSYRRSVGPHYPRLFDDALGWENRSTLTAAECVALYHNHSGQDIVPDRSLAPLLHGLKADGYRLYLVSNGHRQTQLRKVAQLGLESVFSGVYIGHPNDPGNPPKPSPVGYYALATERERDRSIMIGDDVDIDGGFAANVGMAFFWFQYRDVQ